MRCVPRLRHRCSDPLDARLLRRHHSCGGSLLCWPIEVDKELWKAAAPQAAASVPDKAGTLPIAAKCQLEFFAAGGVPDTLPEEAFRACRFMARSILCAGIDEGVRLGESVRVVMGVDDDEPEDVMSGLAYLSKDGSPTEVAAPAEGFLGVYSGGPSTPKTWWRSDRPSPNGFGHVGRPAAYSKPGSCCRRWRSPSTSVTR